MRRKSEHMARSMISPSAAAAAAKSANAVEIRTGFYTSDMTQMGPTNSQNSSDQIFGRTLTSLRRTGALELGDRNERWALRPDGKIRTIFDWLQIIMLFVDIFVVPFLLGFAVPEEGVFFDSLLHYHWLLDT
jgi:hypothetical protein